jgi:hypothetical protein
MANKAMRWLEKAIDRKGARLVAHGGLSQSMIERLNGSLLGPDCHLLQPVA